MARNDVAGANDRINELTTIALQLERPVDKGWISMRIATLLGHYYASDTAAGFKKAIAQDWVQILDGLPKWAIEGACHDWLGGETSRKKPTPGEVVALAKARMSVLTRINTDIETAKQIVARADEPEATPESRARVQKLVDNFKRNSTPY